jgi:glycine betaine catabolism B
MIELLTETATQEPQRIRGLEMPWNRVMGSTGGPARAAHALGPWHPQEFMAECVETVPEAGGMMTFVFRRCDGAPLAFRAGQYVNVAFPLNGEDQDPVDRSYSLSSSPTQPWTFNITVKCDPTGLVSPWVHENVKPGTVLEMLGPVGAFHLPDADRRARYLLLAAGAGITPIMSMLRPMSWCSTTERRPEDLPSTRSWPTSPPWTRASRSFTPWATAVNPKDGNGSAEG